MSDIDSLALSLQPHYSYFNVANRLLFTGHSHQAWPDVAFEGVRECLTMVSESVDLKWEKAFEKKSLNPEVIQLAHEDPVGKTGGFLSLSSPNAHKFRTELLKRNVHTDARGSILRISLAPYITEQQCIEAIDILSEIVRKFQK